MADIIKGIRDFVLNEPAPAPVPAPVQVPAQVPAPVPTPVQMPAPVVTSTPSMVSEKTKEKRSFTVVQSDVAELGGRYIAATPIAAARKACRQIFKKTTKNLVRFVLKETTRSGDKKQFSYVANRELMKEPKVIRRGDREIKYTMTYSVKACLGPKED
jgi:hypothetical protein